MTKAVGLWIDHRKAVIVVITGKTEEIISIIAKVNMHPGHPDGERSTASYEPQLVKADDIRQRELMGHLNVYYDAVIAAMQGAEAILIFGPGEAKGELRKRMEGSPLAGHVVEMETVDRMTDRQIAARVRQHFLS
jgi:hypothetical protein